MMTDNALPRIARADALTDALRRSGVLGDGAVRDVTVENSRPTILSRVMRLRLTYDGDQAAAPESLFLKTGLPERVGAVWNSGKHEAAFYTQVAAAMPVTLVPRCYDAECNEAGDEWHVLLEDLTD